MRRHHLRDGDVSLDLDWYGDELSAAVKQAAAEAINAAAQEAVQDAKARHWFKRRTGGHLRSVRIFEKATPAKPVATWGAGGRKDAVQALGLDLRKPWLRASQDRVREKLASVVSRAVGRKVVEKLPPAPP